MVRGAYLTNHLISPCHKCTYWMESWLGGLSACQALVTHSAPSRCRPLCSSILKLRLIWILPSCSPEELLSLHPCGCFEPTVLLSRSHYSWIRKMTLSIQKFLGICEKHFAHRHIVTFWMCAYCNFDWYEYKAPFSFCCSRPNLWETVISFLVLLTQRGPIQVYKSWRLFSPMTLTLQGSPLLGRRRGRLLPSLRRVGIVAWRSGRVLARSWTVRIQTFCLTMGSRNWSRNHKRDPLSTSCIYF
jgi:hypothetical protein